MAFQESSFRARQRTVSTAVAGLVGGVVGFALSETYQTVYDRNGREYVGSNLDILLSIGVWFALVVLGIGAAVTAADAAVNRDWKKARFLVARAAPFLIVGGIIAGYVAQIVYQNIVDFDAVRQAYDRCYASGDRYCAAGLAGQLPGRAIGWGVAGLLGGIPIGLAASSRRLAQNGAVGGLVGGLVGGAAFDPIGQLISGPIGVPRLIGIVLIGTLIGLAFSVITAARTSAFIEVLTGDQAGTQFPITDERTLVGCATNAAITLRGDRNIREHHFELRWDGTSASFACVRNSPDISIDGVAAATGDVPFGAVIRVGDTQIRLLGAKSRGTLAGPNGIALGTATSTGPTAAVPTTTEASPHGAQPPDRPTITTQDVPRPTPKDADRGRSGGRSGTDPRPSRPTIPTKQTDADH
jgi:hypothetical protein